MMNEEMKNDMTETQEEMTPEAPEMPNTLKDDAPNHKGAGPLVGIIIIILLLVLGGWYLWQSKVETANDGALPSAEETQAEVEALKTQGTSDAISDIEADLGATDLSGIDSDLDALLNEL